MGILVENIIDIQGDSEGKSPNFFLVKSTAPINLEDDVFLPRDQESPTIQNIIKTIYQESEIEQNTVRLTIVVHGYSTSLTGLRNWCKSLYQFITSDSLLSSQGRSLVFIGYRWPSESDSNSLIRDSLNALPLLLKFNLTNGILLSALCFVLFLVFQSWSFYSFFFLFPAVPGLCIVAFIYCLITLRASCYFRDSYRAENFGVPDLVELIRQIDIGLIHEKWEELFKENWLVKVKEHVPGVSEIDEQTLADLAGKIRAQFSGVKNLVIDENNLKFKYLYRRLMQCKPEEMSDKLLLELVKHILLLDRDYYDVSVRYWKQKQIHISFIGLGLGSHIVTQAVQNISSIFSSEIDSPSKIGNVFKLSQLILVAPDIPFTSLTHKQTSSLKSSLRHFKEAYIFSSAGDTSLKIVSATANYLSFPSRTRYVGSRLGNIAVQPSDEIHKDKQKSRDYGVVNLFEIDKTSQLLRYLHIPTIGKNSTKQGGEYALISEFQAEHTELLASDLCSYFDCTEYKDFTVYGQGRSRQKPSNLLILNGQKYPLSFWDDLRLLKAFLTGKVDIQFGYFLGSFMQVFIFRLAFLGFQEFLDSLIETLPHDFGIAESPPRDLQISLNEVRGKIEPNTLAENDTLLYLQEKRRIALDYFSWICAQKQIRAVISPKRYQIDILGRENEFDLRLPMESNIRDVAIAFEKTNEAIKQRYPEIKFEIENADIKEISGGDQQLVVSIKQLDEFLARAAHQKINEIFQQEYIKFFNSINDTERSQANRNSRVLQSEQKVIEGLLSGATLSGNVIINIAETIAGSTTMSDYSIGDINARDIVGSPIQLGSNTASVQIQQASLPEPASVDIRAELNALKEIILSLNDPIANGVAQKLAEEAQKPQPDKSVIGTTLETGLTYAKNLQGFAEAIDKLRPHVEKAAGWLGENWYKLLPLVGLAI